MEKLFENLKNEILRIIGKNDSVQKAETTAELLTGLQALPSVSEHISKETEQVKGDLTKSFDSKIEEIKSETKKEIASLSSDLKSLVEVVSKVNLKLEKGDITAGNASQTSLTQEKETDKPITEEKLREIILEASLGKK